MKDFYSIMGVQPNATAEQIRDAYLQKAKDLHPDKHQCMCGTTGPCVHRRKAEMQDLNEAYETLKDPAKRRAYDLQYKVKQFTPKVEEGGRVNLVSLFRQFATVGRVPSEVVDAVSPILARKLDEHGITAEAATAEQVLEAIGWLKPKRRRKRAS